MTQLIYCKVDDDDKVHQVVTSISDNSIIAILTAIGKKIDVDDINASLNLVARMIRMLKLKGKENEHLLNQIPDSITEAYMRSGAVWHRSTNKVQIQNLTMYAHVRRAYLLNEAKVKNEQSNISSTNS